MLTSKTLLLIGFSCCWICIGCNKSSPSQPFTDGVDVYMAGYVGDTAAYWKNGQKVNLTDGNIAECIAVSGTDVYVGGEVYATPYELAVYWKNGVRVVLTFSSISHVSGIANSGTDIYCVGDILFGYQYAVYWKNDSIQVLSPGSESFAQGITFSGSDIYMAGGVYSSGPVNDTAVIWKNGVQTNYSSDSGSFGKRSCRLRIRRLSVRNCQLNTCLLEKWSESDTRDLRINPCYCCIRFGCLCRRRHK